MAFGPTSGQASDSCLPLGSVAVIASASALVDVAVDSSQRQVGLRQMRIGLVDRRRSCGPSIRPSAGFARGGRPGGRSIPGSRSGSCPTPGPLPESPRPPRDPRPTPVALAIDRIELTLLEQLRRDAGVCGLRRAFPPAAQLASPPGRSPPAASWPDRAAGTGPKLLIASCNVSRACANCRCRRYSRGNGSTASRKAPSASASMWRIASLQRCCKRGSWKRPARVEYSLIALPNCRSASKRSACALVLAQASSHAGPGAGTGLGSVAVPLLLASAGAETPAVLGIAVRIVVRRRRVIAVPA